MHDAITRCCPKIDVGTVGKQYHNFVIISEALKAYVYYFVSCAYTYVRIVAFFIVGKRYLRGS